MKTKITKLLALISVVSLCCSSTNADLLVSGFDSGNVVRFDQATGAFLDEFITYGTGGLTRAEGMAIGPDGRLYVANFGGGTVLRFDLATGAFIDVFAGGLSEPVGLIFRSGFLYVSEYAGSSVKRFDATTGAFIDVFVPAGSGGLYLAHGITFGPDSHLYVSSNANAQVLRYDGASGAFIDVFASGGGLSVPTSVVFGPDANLYVSSNVGDKVLRFDGVSGASLGVFISSTPDPHQIHFGNDGRTYVVGGTDVLRYDTASGAFLDVFATSLLLNRATYMIFTDSGGGEPPLDCLLASLHGTSQSQQEMFGYAVAIDGDTAVVGARVNNQNGPDAGAVYVFGRNSGGINHWGLIKTLFASDATPGQQFGASVSVSGDHIVVGAAVDSQNGPGAGAAYLFGRNEGGANQWGQIVKLVAPDGDEGDAFGHAVVLNGETLVATSVGDEAAGPITGAAYVFERNEGGPGQWGFVKKLLASDASANRFFGVAVALAGNILAVGSPRSGVSTFNGSVYLFERNNGGPDQWGQTKKLMSPSGNPLDEAFFGSSIGLSQDSLVATAYDTATGTLLPTYVFERDHGGTDNWGYTQFLDLQNIPDDFGEPAAAMSGGRIVVGVFDGNGGGVVYEFMRTECASDPWRQVERIDHDSSSNVGFGWAVGISESTFLVGALPFGTGSPEPGAAFVFDCGSQVIGDTTAPALTCPANIVAVLPCSSGSSMPVNFAATASDACDPSPTIMYSHAPGSNFPIGTTTVTVTAEDASGNPSECSFTVTVQPQPLNCEAIQATPDRSRVHFDHSGNSEFAFFRGNLAMTEGHLAPDFRVIPGGTARGSLRVTIADTVVYCKDDITFTVHDCSDPTNNREKWKYNAGPKEKVFLRWKDDQEYDATRDPNVPSSPATGNLNIGKLETRFIHDDETRFRYNFKDATKPITITVDGLVLVTVAANGTVSSPFPFWKYSKVAEVLFPDRLVPGNEIAWYADGDLSNNGGLPENLIYQHDAAANGNATDTYFNAGGRFFIKVPVAGLNLSSLPRSAQVEFTIGQQGVTLVGCSSFTVPAYDVVGKNWKFNDGPDDCESED